MDTSSGVGEVSGYIGNPPNQRVLQNQAVSAPVVDISNSMSNHTTLKRKPRKASSIPGSIHNIDPLIVSPSNPFMQHGVYTVSHHTGMKDAGELTTSIALRDAMNQVYLSDLSQLTLNDSTMCSTDTEEMLLEPISFRDSFPKGLPNALSAPINMHFGIMGTDVKTLANANDYVSDPKFPSQMDSVHDFLSIVSNDESRIHVDDFELNMDVNHYDSVESHEESTKQSSSLRSDSIPTAESNSEQYRYRNSSQGSRTDSGSQSESYITTRSYIEPDVLFNTNTNTNTKYSNSNSNKSTVSNSNTNSNPETIKFGGTNIHDNNKQELEINHHLIPTTASCLSSSSNINTSTNSNSNIDTPSSKLLNNSDVSTSNLKRSFTRLKQTSELINTEKVYLCSLKLLEHVYLNNFMSDTSTPIYFNEFRECVIQLLQSHQILYNSLVEIYQKWHKDSIDLVNICEATDPNINTHIDENATSPNFDNFNYVSNEQLYMENIVRLLSTDAIDVDLYSRYCSLYHRVLSFSGLNEIENYKRESFVILNDYLVEHQSLHTNFSIDRHLDTRFISVVQMPTTRMVRYKLILQSLLKNIELDELNKQQLKFYSKCAEKVNVKIDSINDFVGDSEMKLLKLQDFKDLFSKTGDQLFPTKLFLENLSDLHLASAFTVVYKSKQATSVMKSHSRPKSNLLHSEYLVGTLFKSHLILSKCSQTHSNTLELKFVIPLMSIFDISHGMPTLVTPYEFVLNIKFEDKFNIYEISMLFPDEKEMLLWEANMKKYVDKLNCYNSKKPSTFAYSDIQRRILSIDLNDEVGKFNVSSVIPPTIGASTQVNHDIIVQSTDEYFYDVDHFDSSFCMSGKVGTIGTPTSRGFPRNNSTISINADMPIEDSCVGRRTSKVNSISGPIKNGNIPVSVSSNSLSSHLPKIQIIKVSIQERVYAQTCIASIWSPQFEIYTLSSSIGRSFSNLLLHSRSLLSMNSPSTPTTSTFIPPSPSFMNPISNGSPGSPMKLRNSMSMKNMKANTSQSSDPSIMMKAGTPSTPDLNSGHNTNLRYSPSSLCSDASLKRELTNESSADFKHTNFVKPSPRVRHSSSFKSLSKFIGGHRGNGDTSIRSQLKHSQSISSFHRESHGKFAPPPSKHTAPSKAAGPLAEIPSSAASIASRSTAASITTTSSSSTKLGNSMSTLWKNFISSNSKRSRY